MKRIGDASLLLLLAGYAIWGVAFNLLYGLHAIGCEAGWQDLPIGPVSALRGVLGLAYAIHIAIFAGLLLYQRRLLQRTTDEARAGVLRIGFMLAVSALFASGFILLPTVVLKTCGVGPVV